MCLSSHTARERQILWQDHAVGFVVIGGARVNVAGLVHKRDPLIEPVGERYGVEVCASQVIAVLGIEIGSAVCAILDVQYPSGIVALRIGVEDAREREA